MDNSKSPSSDVVKCFTALEERWVEALVKGDTETLSAILADTYIDTNADGTRTNKDGILCLMRSQDLKLKSITISEMSVELYGSAAVVTGTAVQKGAYKGSPHMRSVVFTDVFVDNQGCWQAVASQRSPRH
jgi:hypothetical protein